MINRNIGDRTRKLGRCRAPWIRMMPAGHDSKCLKTSKNHIISNRTCVHSVEYALRVKRFEMYLCVCLFGCAWVCACVCMYVCVLCVLFFFFVFFCFFLQTNKQTLLRRIRQRSAPCGEHLNSSHSVSTTIREVRECVYLCALNLLRPSNMKVGRAIVTSMRL